MDRIAQYLIRKDPALKRVIDGRAPVRRYHEHDVYLSLLASIVSQQLSVKAADTIFRRFLDLFPDHYPHPERLLRKRSSTLRKAGLSRQKASYLKAVAAFAKRRGMDYSVLNRMSDRAIIELLTEIQGVGRWTVEMLLMFPLDRPDVFPADDLGIQRAMKSLYRLRVSGPRLKPRLERIAERWRPYRSIACKYMWQAQDDL